MNARFLIAVLITLSLVSLQAQQCTGDAYTGNLLQGVKATGEGYAIGSPVEFVFAVRNTGDKPITYTFSSAKQFDLWVTLAGREIFTLSKNRVYLQMVTQITLKPGETKNFTATWDQKDNSGKNVGPGTYTVCAQLTPQGEKPPAVDEKFIIGKKTAALVPLVVKETIKRAKELEGRRVQINGIFMGFQPDPSDPNTKDGPPVTRSDWAVCDSTGCIYVTGQITLDPDKGVGTKISVIGKVKKTEKGQVYLVLESALI